MHKPGPRTVQLEPDEFEFTVTLHPHRRVILPRHNEPYQINRVMFSGPVFSYTLLANRYGGEAPIYRGEEETDVLADSVRIESKEDIYVQFEGQMSTEATFICSPAKRND